MPAVGPVRRMLVATVVGLALAGCNSVGFATQPNRPDGGPICEDTRTSGSVRVLSCAEAVAAAEASLGLHWAITSAAFDLGDDGSRDPGHIVCSSREACPSIRRGSVRFEFSTGDPVVIYIILDDADVPVVTEPNDADAPG